jgi:hypothetical protein
MRSRRKKVKVGRIRLERRLEEEEKKEKCMGPMHVRPCDASHPTAMDQEVTESVRSHGGEPFSFLISGTSIRLHKAYE